MPFCFIYLQLTSATVVQKLLQLYQRRQYTGLPARDLRRAAAAEVAAAVRMISTRPSPIASTERTVIMQFVENACN